MTRPSPLEIFLRSCEQGEVDSQGEFTLDIQRSLEKMAAYQLPFPFCWVLKIVQAAVASGAEKLDIKQTKTDTHFRFSLPWDEDVLFKAFHQPPDEDRALAHLMTGLWAASLNDGRPFSINTGSAQTLLWTGREMRRVSSSATRGCEIVVSHRRLSEGHAFPFVHYAETALTNANVLRLLSSHATFCPIALRVDGRRLSPLDTTDHCVDHHHYLISGYLDGLGPKFAMSPETQIFLKGGIPQRILPPEVTSVWSLAVYLGKRKYLRSWFFAPRSKKSKVAWLSDGVILQTDVLPVPPNWARVFMVVSAEGLKTDLGGFALLESEERDARLRQACLGVSKGLGETKDPNLQEILGEFIPGSNVIGGVVSLLAGGGAGLLIGFAAPVLAPIGMLAGAVGGVWTFAANNEPMQSKPIRSRVRTKLRQFAKVWLETYPPE